MIRPLTISKKAVMQEVAQTTSYTGAKMSDSDAYERISTVDEDESVLRRLWDESRADACQTLMRIVASEGINGDNYTMNLNLSSSFDETQLPSMQIDLFSYFVQSVVAKWYVFTNKEEAGAYADNAVGMLDNIHRKALYKRKPTRPTYD